MVRTPIAAAAVLLLTNPARAEIRQDTRLDVEYARRGDLPLLLDARIPQGKGPFPAIVMVHGGGWRNMNKDHINIAPLFPVFDRTGMAWFSIDYRLAPQHRYPAAVEDVQEAVRWVRRHAKTLRVDPDRIALIGESAGGHLVAQAALRAPPDARVAAVVPFYTIYDLKDLVRDGMPDRSLREFLGIQDLGEDSLRLLSEASPRTHVKAALPPFLIICGTEDHLNHKASVEMCAALKAAGNRCDFFEVKDGIHGVINWEKVREQQDYKAHLIDWLQRTLRAPPLSAKPRVPA
jgi:acetyl esterase/lipase